jgi:hypothetical protein
MTKHKHPTRRRNKLHRASKRRSKTRRSKTRRSSLIKRIGGNNSMNYEPRDFFDPDLDTALERSFNRGNDVVTQEEQNTLRLYSLLSNLTRRISGHPDNPRISVWNELFNYVNTILENDDIDAITRIANKYDNARELAYPALPDFHPDM